MTVWMLLGALAVAAPHRESPPLDDVADALTDELVPEAPMPPISFDLSAAVPLDALTTDEHRWLKPRRHLLEQNPYAQTDFTAYTLEWGELRVGLASVAFGVLPRVQLGTVPALDLLGVYNGQIKVNALRVGPLDLAVVGSHYALPQSDFAARYTNLGGQVSLRVLSPWSIHGNVRYGRASAAGIPDFTKISPLLSPLGGDPGALDGSELDITPEGMGEVVTFEVATDLRFNRRDAIVLRFGAVAYAHAAADVGFDPPAILGMDRTFDQQTAWPVADSYVVSLAYQVSFSQLQFRVGGGHSALPMAWALQGLDLNLRVGGQTRVDEGRARRTWRKNKKDIGTARDVLRDTPEGSVQLD